MGNDPSTHDWPDSDMDLAQSLEEETASRLGQEQVKTPGQVRILRAETEYLGPWPHPEHWAKYEAALPGAADRISTRERREAPASRNGAPASNRRAFCPFQYKTGGTRPADQSWPCSIVSRGRRPSHLFRQALGSDLDSGLRYRSSERISPCNIRKKARAGRCIQRHNSCSASLPKKSNIAT